MTVQELIQQLQRFPGDARVLLYPVDLGFNDQGIACDIAVAQWQKKIGYPPFWYHSAAPLPNGEVRECVVLLGDLVSVKPLIGEMRPDRPRDGE